MKSNAGSVPKGLTARQETYLEAMTAYDALPIALRDVIKNAPLQFSPSQVLQQWQAAERQGISVHRVEADLRRAIKRTMEVAADSDDSPTRH